MVRPMGNIVLRFRADNPDTSPFPCPFPSPINPPANPRPCTHLVLPLPHRMAPRLRPHRHHDRSPRPPPNHPIHPSLPPRRLHRPEHPHRRQRGRQHRRPARPDRRPGAPPPPAGRVHGQGHRGLGLQLSERFCGHRRHFLVGAPSFPPPYIVPDCGVLMAVRCVRYGAGEIGKQVPSKGTEEAVAAAGVEDEIGGDVVGE